MNFKYHHMKKKTGLLLIILAFGFSSCTNDSESDLIEITDPNETVTYAGEVEAIIRSNCLACHSDPPRNGAPFPLSNFEQLRQRAESGAVLRAIQKQTGEAGAMPPSGRLPQATIDLIDQWIQDGLLEQ